MWYVVLLEKMEMSLIGAVVVDQEDVQMLCTTGFASHWMQHSGELAPSLISGSIWESGFFPSSELHCTAGPGGKGYG